MSGNTHFFFNMGVSDWLNSKKWLKQNQKPRRTGAAAAAAAASVETGRRRGLRELTEVDYSKSAGREGGHKRRRTRGNEQANDSDEEDNESDSDDLVMVSYDVFKCSPKELTVPSNFVGGFVGVDQKGVRFVISHTPAIYAFL